MTAQDKQTGLWFGRLPTPQGPEEKRGHVYATPGSRAEGSSRNGPAWDPDSSNLAPQASACW